MSDEPTQIEDLPNELFLEVFSFIEPKDLFQGWYNLNFHINAILRSASISIEIKNDNDFNDSLSCLHHFQAQIIYLRDDRLVPNTRIDVRPLINIRCLHLSQCSSEQYKHIHSGNQPHLTHFSSPSVPWSFYERILFEPTRFAHLRSIGCPRGASVLLLTVAHPINTTIRHLHLHSASYETVSKFIEYLPNMNTLTIDYLYGSTSSSPTSLIKSSVHHLTITHILSSQFYFEQLLLCLEFSNITYIRVTFNTCDFEQLASILTKLSRLKHFHLRVEAYPSNIDLNFIRRINPWFLSLDYGQVVDQHTNNKAPLIAISSKRSV